MRDSPEFSAARIRRYKAAYRDYVASLVARDKEAARIEKMATRAETSGAAKSFKSAYPRTTSKVLEESGDLFRATGLIDLISVDMKSPVGKTWDIENGMEARSDGLFYHCLNCTFSHADVARFLMLTKQDFTFHPLDPPNLLTLDQLTRFLKDPISNTNIPLISFSDPAWKGFVGKVH